MLDTVRPGRLRRTLQQLATAKDWEIERAGNQYSADAAASQKKVPPLPENEATTVTQLEEQIATLAAPPQRVSKGFSIIAGGTQPYVTDTPILWDALESRYEHLLDYLISESLTDSLRVAACEMWEEDTASFRTATAEFESSLRTGWSWLAAETHASSQVPAPEEALLQQLKRPAVVAQQRLLLNLLNRSPAERSPEVTAEIPNLSQKTILAAGLIPQELSSQQPRDAVSVPELWHSVIGICGWGLAVESSVEGLRLLIANSLRVLEEICRRDIAVDIKLAGVEAFDNGTTAFEALLKFCILNQSGRGEFSSAEELTSDPILYWQLLYWCARTGSLEAIPIALNEIERKGIFRDSRREMELYITIATLLFDKLRETSRPETGQPVSVHSELATIDNLLALIHADDLSTLGLDDFYPLVSLLVAVLYNEGRSVPLQRFLPSCTIEDYLWFHWHVTLLKPAVHRPEEVAKLQKKVLDAGPGHFSSADKVPRDFTFARTLTLALAPTFAFDWLRTVRPDLTLVCLQMLAYLAQYNIIGSSRSLLHIFFPDARGALGTTCLKSAFSSCLVEGAHPVAKYSPELALQLAELLPPNDRQEVVSNVITMIASRLVRDAALQRSLIGHVGSDGSGRGGLVFRALIAPTWDTADSLATGDPAQALARQREAGRDLFESLVNMLIDEAVQADELLTALRLSWLIEKDHACLRYLLAIFSDKRIFPWHPISAEQHEEVAPLQQEALQFYCMFASRSERDTPLAASLQLLANIRRAIDVYQLSSMGRIEQAWAKLLDSGLYPSGDIIIRWSENSDLVKHLPRLIEVGAAYLNAQAQQVPRNPANREKALELLSSASRLPPSVEVSSAYLRVLRNLCALL